MYISIPIGYSPLPIPYSLSIVPSKGEQLLLDACGVELSCDAVHGGLGEVTSGGVARQALAYLGAGK